MESTKIESKFKAPSINKGQPQPKMSSETLGINPAQIPQPSSNSAWVNPNNPYSKRKNEIDEKKIKQEDKQSAQKDFAVPYYSKAQCQNKGTSDSFNSIIKNLKITIDYNDNSEEESDKVSIINLVPPSPSTQQGLTEDDSLLSEEEEEKEEEVHEAKQQSSSEEDQSTNKCLNHVSVDLKRSAIPFLCEGQPAKKHFSQREASKLTNNTSLANKDSSILDAFKNCAILNASKHEKTQTKVLVNPNINTSFTLNLNNNQQPISKIPNTVSPKRDKDSGTISEKFEKLKTEFCHKPSVISSIHNSTSSQDNLLITNSPYFSKNALDDSYRNNQANFQATFFPEAQSCQNHMKYNISENQLIAGLQNLSLDNSHITQLNQREYQDTSQGNKLAMQQSFNNDFIYSSDSMPVQNQQQQPTLNAQCDSSSYENQTMNQNSQQNPATDVSWQNHRRELMEFMKQWNISSQADCEEVMIDILSKMNVQRAKQWLYHHHPELEAMASTLILVALKELGLKYGINHGQSDAEIKALDTEELLRQYAALAKSLKSRKEPNQQVGFTQGEEVLKNTMALLFSDAKKRWIENLDDLIKMGMDQKIDELIRELNEIMEESASLNDQILQDQIRRFYELEEIEQNQKQLLEVVCQIEAKLEERNQKSPNHILITHMNRCEEAGKRVRCLEEKIKQMENKSKKPESCISNSQLRKSLAHIKEKIEEAQRTANKMRNFLKNHKR